MKRIFSVSVALFLLGCTDPVTGLKMSINNNLNQSIELRLYFLSFDSNQQTDSLIVELMPGAVYELTEYDRGANDSYPEYLHRFFPVGDSLKIFFNDSIVITHLNLGFGTRDSLSQVSEIYFSENRNIYNPVSFIQKKHSENYFIGTYEIRQEDLNYAISVFE